MVSPIILICESGEGLGNMSGRLVLICGSMISKRIDPRRVSINEMFAFLAMNPLAKCRSEERSNRFELAATITTSFDL